MLKYTPPYNTRSSGKKEIANKDEDKDKDEKKDENDIGSTKIIRDKNHIYFHSEVNRNSIFTLVELIRSCEIENITTAHKLSLEDIPIFLHINSFGGSVFDALTAIDVIKGCKVPVYTVIEGATASAGTLMSVVGIKRYMRPNSYMLIHQLSAGSWGKMCELEDNHANNKLIMKKILDIYKEHTNIPKKKLDEILKHDLWWEIDKCIEYGLVDEEWDRT
jgi:ATP-dependent protease ClpP protease subunit